MAEVFNPLIYGHPVLDYNFRTIARILESITSGEGIPTDRYKDLSVTADKLATAAATFPSGIIVMWSGTLATVPDGWSLCDGSGSTPDLRDKFIYGWTNALDPGDSGGATTHTHTYSDLPQHNHGVGTLVNNAVGTHTHSDGTLSADAVGNHTHSYNDKYLVIGYPRDYIDSANADTRVEDHGRTTGSGGGHGHGISGNTGSGGGHGHTISGDTAASGVASPETDAGSTLPPYYKLAFIMKD